MDVGGRVTQDAYMDVSGRTTQETKSSSCREGQDEGGITTYQASPPSPQPFPKGEGDKRENKIGMSGFLLKW